MIYSKRDTMNHVAIDKLKGVFFDKLKKIKEERDLEKQKKRLREISTENKRKIREQWEKENPDYEFGLSFGLEKQDWVSKEEARKMEEMERDM